MLRGAPFGERESRRRAVAKTQVSIDDQVSVDYMYNALGKGGFILLRRLNEGDTIAQAADITEKSVRTAYRTLKKLRKSKLVGRLHEDGSYEISLIGAKVLSSLPEMARMYAKMRGRE